MIFSVLFLNKNSQEPAFSGSEKVKGKSHFLLFHDYFLITEAHIGSVVLFESMYLICLDFSSSLKLDQDP